MKRFNLWAAFSALFVIGCGGSGGSNVTSNGKTVSTLAGGAGYGSKDGTGSGAEFANPVNCAVGPDGTVYVADFDFGLIRKVTQQGVVSTLTSQADFQLPFGIAISSSGALYVGTDNDDSGNHGAQTGTVWSVNTTTGVATVIARDVGRPRGLAVLSNGMLVVSDVNNNTIRLLNPSTGAFTPVAGQSGVAGYANGTGTNALFSRPYGVAVQSDGTILVADQTNNRIRQVTIAGLVTTFAGLTASGAKDGPIATALFNGPQDVKVDGAGNVYVADTDGKKVREISHGVVSTVAGNGVAGFRDGPALQAEFYGLEGFDVTSSGKIYVADGNGGDDNQPFNRVRVVQ